VPREGFKLLGGFTPVKAGNLSWLNPRLTGARNFNRFLKGYAKIPLGPVEIPDPA